MFNMYRAEVQLDTPGLLGSRKSNKRVFGKGVREQMLGVEQQLKREDTGNPKKKPWVTTKAGKD